MTSSSFLPTDFRTHESFEVLKICYASFSQTKNFLYYQVKKWQCMYEIDQSLQFSKGKACWHLLKSLLTKKVIFFPLMLENKNNPPLVHCCWWESIRFGRKASWFVHQNRHCNHFQALCFHPRKHHRCTAMIKRTEESQSVKAEEVHEDNDERFEEIFYVRKKSLCSFFLRNLDKNRGWKLWRLRFWL